jgi:hypothetical protein
MHAIRVEEHMSGWFPAIGLRVTSWADFSLVVLIVGAALATIALVIHAGKKMLGRFLGTTMLFLIKLTVHILTLASESICMLYHTVCQIPTPWYPTAALTAIPIAVDIPRWASVMYLLVYCAANVWIMACGIKEKGPSVKTNEETKLHVKLHDPASMAAKQAPRSLNSQFFTGLRITIQ